MDGSWEGTLIGEPVTLDIEQGVIASITGGDMAGASEEFERGRALASKGPGRGRNGRRIRLWHEPGRT